MHNLISQLIAIENNAKDVHYSTNDFSVHLMADKIGENLPSYIDDLKELYYLGHGNKVPHSDTFLRLAVANIPESSDLKGLKQLIILTLDNIESLKNYTKGESKLLDDISFDLQKSLALINLIEDKNV